MKFTETDIRDRRPVWEALSTLFLDTDVSLLREYRVSKLSESPYSIKEIENILIYEVYPICRGNLFQIAGEWAGFDINWLERKIRNRITTLPGYLHKFSLGRITIHCSLGWRRTKEAIEDTRSTEVTNGSTV